MKKKITLCTTIVLFISCSTPKKSLQNNNTLPPITQTGANSLGCKLEGIPFIPSQSKSLGFGTNFGKQNPSISIGKFPLDSLPQSFSIRAKGYSQNLVTLRIYLYNLSLKGTGTYSLGQGGEISTPKHSYIYTIAKSPNTGKWTRYYSFANSGEITITRKDNAIFSGVFNGYLKNENNDETLRVTEGRFDIDINKINSLR